MDEDLLNDLDDLGEDNLEDNVEAEVTSDNAMENEETQTFEENELAHKALLNAIKNTSNIRSIARLLNSKQLQDILSKIDYHLSQPNSETTGSDDHPEYKLILQSNNLTVDIDNELTVVHKFIRDHFAPKFPELEQLVRNELDYSRVDVMKVDLRSLLPASIVMVVTVASSTSKGRQLSEPELAAVFEGCDMALDLEAARMKILGYVESRMNIIAPNLSAIVGSTTAAKLLGFAGGLQAFCNIPACNVIVLGKLKKNAAGLSSAGVKRHIGVIYGCEFVERTPEEFKRRAARLVSSKCTLAARVDAAKEALDGSIGEKLFQEIQKKLEKEMEPPPGKSIKALPIPDEGPKKRRGGKRVRKMKEKYAITELSKQQNRMSFGVAEDEVGSMDETTGLGLIGNQTGKIRSTVTDSRTKLGVSKNLAKRQKMISGHSTNPSGLSSSLAFTPVQGIELENPEAAKQKIKDANNRYFSGGS
ncbi:U4/U6-U5 snRNP complex subunit prp31, partial [Nowakowskiella sp. JEL0078]